MKKTIKRDIFFVLIIGLLLPLLFGVYLYFFSIQKLVRDNLVLYQRLIVHQTADKIDSIFTSFELIQHPMVAAIAETRLFGHRDELSDREKLKLKIELIESAHVYCKTSEHLSGIYIIDDQENVYTSQSSVVKEELLDQDFIQAIKHSKEREIISSPHIAHYSSGLKIHKKSSVISIVKRVHAIADPDTEIILMIDLYTSSFTDLMEGVANESNIPLSLYMDKDEVLLSNALYSEALKRTSIILEQPEYRINRNLFLRGIIEQERVTEFIHQSMLGSWIIAFILFFVSFFSATFFTNKLTKPLVALRRAMEQVGEGDFEPDFPSIEYEDIRFLDEGFRTMVRRINILMKETVIKTNEAKEAELRSLQAKVNPHFLYNTMDVMRGMAVVSGQDAIADMAYSLSCLFRYSIQGGGSDLVPLKDELKALDDYIKIQSARFGSRIHYRNSIPSDLLSLYVIKLSLQPIIENSFIHGLDKKTGTVSVDVDGFLEDKLLSIVISDNGMGMATEDIASLNKILSEPPCSENLWKYGGIENVNLRIKLLFGQTYGIRAEPGREKGLRIVLKLPYRREKNA